jgi:hypothetical protein
MMAFLGRNRNKEIAADAAPSRRRRERDLVFVNPMVELQAAGRERRSSTRRKFYSSY